jgi:hypothetical protein
MLDRRRIFIPEQRVFLTHDFEMWSCVLECPPLDSTENSLAIIYLKLHYSESFIFELTDVQAEVGVRPTRFKYVAPYNAKDRPSSGSNRSP